MTPEIRGFPIRTSQDHSSFTSSPGLIAGYNVLHRLLVPRHPPIALSSLLHLQRCSRPLCSSQHTSGTHNPTNQPAGQTMNRTRNQPPTATDPSGPNSVLINAPPPPKLSTPPTTGSSTHPDTSTTPNSQCSTNQMPVRPGTNAPEPDRTEPAQSRPEGSLERR